MKVSNVASTQRRFSLGSAKKPATRSTDGPLMGTTYSKILLRAGLDDPVSGWFA